MDMLLIEAREALLQRRSRLSTRARGRVEVAVGDAPRCSSETLSEQEREELLHIDEALARIQEGQFGRCARCGGAIGRHRLRAIPEARYCMTCSDAVGR
jgi:DnaK suppressor protein